MKHLIKSVHQKKTKLHGNSLEKPQPTVLKGIQSCKQWSGEVNPGMNDAWSNVKGRHCVNLCSTHISCFVSIFWDRLFLIVIVYCTSTAEMCNKCHSICDIIYVYVHTHIYLYICGMSTFVLVHNLLTCFIAFQAYYV